MTPFFSCVGIGVNEIRLKLGNSLPSHHNISSKINRINYSTDDYYTLTRNNDESHVDELPFNPKKNAFSEPRFYDGNKHFPCAHI